MTCFCIQVRKLPLRPPEKKVLGIPRCWDMFFFCFGMLAFLFFVLFTGFVRIVQIYQMCLLFCSSCWSSNLDGDLQRVVFLLGFFDWFLHHLFLNKRSGYVWGRTVRMTWHNNESKNTSVCRMIVPSRWFYFIWNYWFIWLRCRHKSNSIFGVDSLNIGLWMS